MDTINSSRRMELVVFPITTVIGMPTRIKEISLTQQAI